LIWTDSDSREYREEQENKRRKKQNKKKKKKLSFQDFANHMRKETTIPNNCKPCFRKKGIEKLATAGLRQ